MTVEIRHASIADLDAVTPLFDGYRQFYGQPSDLAVARDFLQDRFRHMDSAILLAVADGQPAGFTQLYPSFTSVGCARIFVLNDLFVAPAHRGKDVGGRLLDAAAEFGRRMGAVRLTLSTAVDNHTAQSVYAHKGWARSDAFLTYNLAL
ncbi:GNAT family N-acetyltransferase [Phenylobacterium sp.]|jgi:GNAT superfamily N-acetyltransferase|uniref:GNAT family N-acetyltransferase n=1 Tax=Phenylobacterium sp. TaxID=1871053 RepID=UPI002F94B572